MQLDAWDSVFVRAGRTAIHSMVADVAGYARWWPRVAVRYAGQGRWSVTYRPRARIAGRHTVELRVTEERAGLGVAFSLRGDVDGEGEWYYLDEADGVVVHYLLRAQSRRHRPSALLATHRAAVRVGMNALKDRLEAGRPPGVEPDAGLAGAPAARAARRGVDGVTPERVAGPRGRGGNQ